MRDLIVATVMVVGALLTVQMGATLLQSWQMAHQPRYADWTFDGNQLTPEPQFLPPRPPKKTTPAAKETLVVVSEGGAY